MGAPPIISDKRKFIPCPNIAICSLIWIASYRLGAMIRAQMLNGSLDNFCIKGKPNTAVFPLPVSALAITLSPLRMEGMASFCMGVGVMYCIF